MSAGSGPLIVDAFSAQNFDGGADDRQFLGAERAVFAGMRIEAGYRKARLARPKRALKAADHDADRRHDQLARKLRDRVA